MGKGIEKGVESRQRILRVALELFSERGYDGTSIEDIRQAAGFKSKASLYTHFQSKEEVARALLQQIQVRQQDFIRQAIAGIENEPFRRFVAVGRAFIEWGMINPREYAFCFLRIQQEILVRGQESYTDLDSTQIFVQLIKVLRAQGYPVRQIADVALMSMAVGLISRAVIDRHAFGTVSLGEKVQQVLEACFGIIFAEPIVLPEKP
ncbi:TetR/AcrR family transcriptional regulator [Ktedonobacter robiniae]|uniref:TetR family transcriptional regulator n=1 Tax=Ktedonobacter robiniae TaxID=2778365 RepID=A0ABQ3V7V5_9CHLR|nr:TetR/AcrR family transcriptional regulator [Ktedonobacter robiniae]GHO60627.1 TetR family transcriptional regulator [Ktedonobacter robiniae]